MPEPHPESTAAASAAANADPVPSRGRPIALHAAIIAVGLIAVFLVRWHSFTEPLEVDEAIYLVIAQDWHQGGALYDSLWDNKPIGTFLIYRAIVALWGSSEAAAHTGAMIAALLTVPCLWLCLRRRPVWQLAVAVCLIWPLFNALASLHMNAANMEVFLLPFLFLALACTQTAVARRSYPHMYAAIACVALAFTIKQVVLPFFVLPLVAWWLGNPHHRSRLALHTAAGAALSVAVLLLVYAIGGFGPIAAIHQQLESVQTVAAQTRPFLIRFPADILSAPIQPSFRLLLPVTVVAIAGLVTHAQQDRRADIDWSAIVFAVLCVPATYLPGRFPHYLILLLPALVIGLVLALDAGRRRQPRRGYVLAALLTLWLGGVAWHQYFSRTPEGIITYKNRGWLVQTRALGLQLRELGITDQAIYVDGRHIAAYVYSGNRPAVRYFNDLNIRQGVVDPEGYLRQIDEAETAYIVLIGPSRLSGMADFLAAHYELISPPADQTAAMIYRRRSGTATTAD